MYGTGHEQCLDSTCDINRASQVRMSMSTGNATRDEQVPPVCHTCRIRRPLRSKHCKITGKCIHAFDHYCPFVGNVVGRDNYKFFFGFIHSMIIAIALVRFVAYTSRHS
jgi:hypothetical protein